MKELAERSGVHRATVNRVAAQAGLQARRVPLSEQRQAEAARLYAEGLTLREVAAKLGTDKDAVRSAVVAHGVTIRSRGRPSVERDNQNNSRLMARELLECCQ